MSGEDTEKYQPVYMGQKRRRFSAPTVAGGGTQVLVARAPFTQLAFDELHLKKVDLEKKGIPEKIKENIYCSKRRTWKLLSMYVPIIKYIRYYKVKENLFSDVLAGFTIGIVHIPQALAFGQLTSVKIENGLFTSLWPVIIYTIFGTSAHISMGTSAVISILAAATIDREGHAWAASRPWIMNQTNNATTLDEVPEYLDFKENLSMAITLITGIMMIAMGFLKLGFITAYLSESFFVAFTSAAAVHIAISQLPAMLGLKIARASGSYKVVVTFIEVCKNITLSNVAAILCSFICCVVILLVKDCVNERFKHKLFAPIPIELFVVIFGTMSSYFGDFRVNYGVDVVGKIPTTIPPPSVPVEGLKLTSNYLADCFILAILIFANTIAMGKVCAKKHNYELNDNQEMLSYGMCNAVSAFFNCFPSAVAPPRSMVASSMNAKTTISGIFSSLLMLLVILIVSRLFEELPKAVLAAIVFIALKGLFIQIFDGRKYWRINKFDFVIWFFTFFGTTFLDIDLGLFIGVGVSLVTVVFQTQFARGYKIGYTKSDPCFVEHKKYQDSFEIPGIKIFRFQSSLYFATAEIFRNLLYRCTVNPRKLLKGLKKREKRLMKDNNERIAQGLPPEQRRNSIMMGDPGLASQNSSSSLNKFPLSPLTDLERTSIPKLVSADSAQAERKRRVSLPNMEKPKFSILEEEEKETNLSNGDLGIPSQTNGVKSSPTTPEKVSIKPDNNSNTSISPSRRMSTISINFDEFEEDPEDGDELFTDDALRQMRKIHHIIIDCTTINYIDASGANVLGHIFTEYGHVNIKVFLAGCSADMRRALEHAGAFEKIPRDNLFIDLHDAIAVAKPLRTLPLAAEALEDFSDEEATEDSYITKI
ncbi:prestin [Biomphalaria pfeifferi]|uniref:Prestin n=1 Tax=Biomphalaria pfeifferi TaxID=112525 RepID=A0AAD8BF84_BIOPF|nr:prestin [Biomphalaria pfeifferi]